MRFDILFIIAGLIFLIIGVVLLIWHIRIKKRCTQKTKGKMISVNVSEDYKGGSKADYYFYPEREYYVNNKRYTTQAKCSTFRFRKLIGKEISVYYNPDKIEDSYFEQDNTILVLAITFIIASIIWFVLFFLYNILNI